MPNATRILRERIVLVFDFDDTLGPSTTPVLAKAANLDYERLSKQIDDMQLEGWQYAIAKAEVFRQLGQSGSRVTRQTMEGVGANYECFPGTDDFVKRLRKSARALDRKIDLEFVLLTAGFGTIPRATKLIKDFDRVYAGELNFDEDGYVLGVKCVITHADKVHYLKQLAEGLHLAKPSELEETYTFTKPEQYYVPLDQVIYVGDGSSDMSAFQLIGEGGGVCVAIDKPGQTWSGYEDISERRRVHNLAEPDYTEAGELMQTLEHAVASMIHRIKVLRLGAGE